MGWYLLETLRTLITENNYKLEFLLYLFPSQVLLIFNALLLFTFSFHISLSVYLYIKATNVPQYSIETTCTGGVQN